MYFNAKFMDSNMLECYFLSKISLVLVKSLIMLFLIYSSVLKSYILLVSGVFVLLWYG